MTDEQVSVKGGGLSAMRSHFFANSKYCARHSSAAATSNVAPLQIASFQTLKPCSTVSSHPDGSSNPADVQQEDACPHSGAVAFSKNASSSAVASPVSYTH